MRDSESWEKDQKLVMHELKRINDQLEKFDDKMDIMSTQVTKLEVKASLWGALGGLLATGITMLGYLLGK